MPSSWHSTFRASTMIYNLSRPRQMCRPLSACRVMTTAQSSTTFTKHAYSSYNATSMPLELRAEARRKEQLEADARAVEKNFTREWRAGDVYAPHDLSAAEAQKWKKRQTPTRDAFDALSMNPLNCYKVSCMIKINYKSADPATRTSPSCRNT